MERVPRWPPGTARERQAILARAFASNLVPQDPIDEPATALRERTRAQRIAQGLTGSTGEGQKQRTTRKIRRA